MIKSIKVMRRGEGKTTQAIELAESLPNSCLIVRTHTEKLRIANRFNIVVHTAETLRGTRYDNYIFDDLFFFNFDNQTLPFTIPGNHYILTSIPDNVTEYHPWFSYIINHFPEELI